MTRIGPPAETVEPDAARARLAGRTLDLVNIPSVSRNESVLLDRLAAALPRGWDVLDRGDACLFASGRRLPFRPFLVLAGHVDTVPAQGNLPGAISREGAIVGLGAADMKGAIAVMLELAAILDRGAVDCDLNVGLLLFGREELSTTESALRPLLERCEPASAVDLAIVMEPTDNALELGCLGNVNAIVTFRGESAHSARPWLGSNAIHRAVRGLRDLVEAGVEDVRVDGLVYREVVNVTRIEGGVAANVIPDEVRCHVNLRYAPSRTPDAAEERLDRLLGSADAAIEVVSNAPPGPVAVRNPLVERLRRAGDLDVRPKQAWTPVAEFAMYGIDAVNFGPGDPALAHRPDERVDPGALERSLDILRRFVASSGRSE